MTDTLLVQTRTVGALRIHTIEAGRQWLDGGAMFGIVPKTLWERRITPDERNRIPLALRCLLIEHPQGPILVDAGIGNKEDAKFMQIYGVENAGANGRTRLEDGLTQLGVRPEDVGMVINTHLHFDHAGGNTYTDSAGTLLPTFPNARYVTQGTEYAFATDLNERKVATYFAKNFVFLRERGQLDLVDGEKEIASGIWLTPTPGHTPGHQSLRITSDGATAFYFADLVPTHNHVPLPWIMGYDVEPLVTLETKRGILARALAEEWTCIFEHDDTVPAGTIVLDGKGYGLRPEQG